MQCLLIQIHGRVQGVGFRYYTQAEAQRLGITGWVRNCADGSVETCICGTDEQLASMQDWLQHGPSLAQVSYCDCRVATAPAHYSTFTIEKR